MAKKRILVIEDEIEMANMIKIRLEANSYEVSLAHDGPSGLNEAQKEKPDLIILDLMLPGMDGYEVCGLLKRDRRYGDIPIIIFSARAQQEDIDMGKKLRADAYIVKPFDPEVLLNKIQELIG